MSSAVRHSILQQISNRMTCITFDRKHTISTGNQCERRWFFLWFRPPYLVLVTWPHYDPTLSLKMWAAEEERESIKVICRSHCLPLIWHICHANRIMMTTKHNRINIHGRRHSAAFPFFSIIIFSVQYLPTANNIDGSVIYRTFNYRPKHIPFNRPKHLALFRLVRDAHHHINSPRSVFKWLFSQSFACRPASHCCRRSACRQIYPICKY